MAGLIESLTEIIAGLLNFFRAIITTILSTITGVFSLVGTTIKEGTHATGSLIDFLLSKSSFLYTSNLLLPLQNPRNTKSPRARSVLCVSLLIYV